MNVGLILRKHHPDKAKGIDWEIYGDILHKLIFFMWHSYLGFIFVLSFFLASSFSSTFSITASALSECHNDDDAVNAGILAMLTMAYKMKKSVANSIDANLFRYSCKEWNICIYFSSPMNES